MYVIGVLESKKRENGSEVIFENILADNFHKSMGHQTTDTEVLCIIIRINAKKTILRHITIN